MNNSSSCAFVKMSAVYSIISIYHIQIILFFTKICKWWCFIVIRFVLGKNLFDWAMAMQIWLSSKTLKNNFGYGIWMLKIKNISFVRDIKGIKLIIPWLNAIYYTSVVFITTSVYKLLHNKVGNPPYVITYPEHDMKISALLASTWDQPPAKTGIYLTLCTFICPSSNLHHGWVSKNSVKFIADIFCYNWWQDYCFFCCSCWINITMIIIDISG